MIQLKGPIPKLLAYLGASGALIGTGCAVGAAIKKPKEEIQYEEGEKPSDEEKLDSKTLEENQFKIENSDLLYYTVHEVKSKNLYSEGVSKLVDKTPNTDECQGKTGEDLKACNCKKWDDQLFYDDIHEKNTEYIYYIKDTDNKKIMISSKKPNSKHTGIFDGWKLYKFQWTGDSKEWYGYCYTSGEEKEANNKCDKLPGSWTKTEA